MAEVDVVKGSGLDLCAYVDANWAKCVSSRRSVTGFCVYFGGTMVSWKSKKHVTVFCSSIESEYRKLSC